MIISLDMSIASCFDSRKYRKMFEPHEDARLRRLVEQIGTDDWPAIAAHMAHRTARQCRERYKMYLCPEVNVSPWRPAEDELLMAKYRELGTKWVEYRPFFRKRTVNSIKNRWHTLARRNHLAEAKLPNEEIEDATADPLAVFNIANLLNRRVLC
jgi:hypothetical protein